MSFTLHGIPVSRGISIGRAHMLTRMALDVPYYLVDEDKLDTEVERSCSAHATVRSELAAFKRDLPSDVPEEMGAFLDVHATILDGALSSQVPETLIRQRRYNAEWALTTQLEELIRQFGETEDEYLRERKADIGQVVERILKVLTGAPALAPAPVAVGCDPDVGMIVVAHDIAPADMLQFRGQALVGFVTDLGGRTSRTVIVARSLDIPTAIDVHNASTLIRQDDVVVIDGDNGIVIVDPSTSILEEYRHCRSKGRLQKKRLERLRHMPTVTLSGTQIELQANIEMPEDAAAVVKAGAVGVGLFRSEFLFMNRHGALPGGEEQFRAYRTAVESMMGLPVTIRTVDIDADKPLDIRDDVFETAPNPALGLRAIRWSLSEPTMFLIQLRVLLRTSALGPIKILVPMLTHTREIDQTLELLVRAKASLDADGLAYDPGIKVGAMIEIPAAVLIPPMFLRCMDFLSIGTNDLIQYTLAIDRADNAVAHLYDLLHPAVLQLTARTIRGTYQAGKPVSVCGEMAGGASMTRLLFSVGLIEFSMYPSQLLSVKQQILRSDRPRSMREVDRLLHACEPAGVEEALGVLART